jgi:hypothetical protein
MEGLERRCRSGVDLLVKASGERGNWLYVVEMQDRKGAWPIEMDRVRSGKANEDRSDKRK